MKHFYRSHTLEVNKQPNGQVVFDIFARGQQHILAGFSQDGSEKERLEQMKVRVDNMLLEAPVQFRV
jgi:hypothetical protein